MKNILTPLMIFFISINLTACIIDSGNQRDVSTMNPPVIRQSSNAADNVTANNTATNNTIEDVPASASAAATGAPATADAKPPMSMNDILDHSMDESDKSHMSRALSANQSAHWKNNATNKSYSMVPSGNASVNGNDECRKFYITVTSGSDRQRAFGTACLAKDDTWQPVR